MDSPDFVPNSTDQTNCVGVLCERPGEHRAMSTETAAMLWIAMGVAAVMALVVGAMLWWEYRGKKRAAAVPVATPQEPAAR